MTTQANIKKAVQDELTRITQAKQLPFRLRVTRMYRPVDFRSFSWLVRPNVPNLHTEEYIWVLAAAEHEVEKRNRGTHLLLIPQFWSKKSESKSKPRIRRRRAA